MTITDKEKLEEISRILIDLGTGIKFLNENHIKELLQKIRAILEK